LTNVGRVLVAGFAALALTAALLEHPGHSRGAGAGSQPSSKVAVVPAFKPPNYPGNTGVPALPVTSPALAKYQFSELPTSMVTTAALKGYDTVILYGIRWSDISISAQAAINEFATTHKVLIWDSDGTGAQTYSTFVHPFSTLSSGQNYEGKPNDSVVSFSSGVNFLASNDPASPYYLNPYELVKDGDEINDMNAMKTGTANWRPALFAANQTIPNGGWVIAWSYGAIADQTGLTIYSGLDADSFTATGWKVNNPRKELAIELAAPFRSTPASCAPGCHLPPPGGGQPYAACSFAKPLPKHWVHGRVTVVLKTSVAAGITGQIVTRSGRVVARGTESKGLLRLVVRTKKLPSNRTSQLQAVVLVKGQPACRKPLRLSVDNVRPRLLQVTTARGAVNLLSLRVSERSWLKIVGRRVHRGTLRIGAHRTIHLRFPPSVRTARLILRDRAGNTVVRRLVWR
jgi:hypothetical protein